MKKMSNQASAQIKRTVASSGQVYYFQGGKRIPAAKAATKWVKQNFDSIQRSKLTEREIKSFRAQEAARKGSEKIRAAAAQKIRFGGKFVPKYLQTILETLKLAAPGQELKKEFPDVSTYGDLLQRIQRLVPSTAIIPETEYGLPSEKRRRVQFEGIIDIAERISEDPLLNRLNLVVFDERAIEYRGRVNALEAVRAWEIEKIEEIMSADKDAAYVSFGHYGEIDVATGTVLIDLRLTDVRVQYSP